MSFQGDVAGLGLGELLQGLARGGREGSLTLSGGTLCATLGVANGQIHLLPEPDENPEIWRRRCERAWVHDPHQRIDVLRMAEIAQAARLETLYSLLDCEGVHFRFEQGPVPVASLDQVSTVADPNEELREKARTKLEVKTPVYCTPMAVESLLLEYARLSDETQRHGDSTQLPSDAVPLLFDGVTPTRDVERFFGECDGASTIAEIADRLASPLRQVRATVQQLGVQSQLRLAEPRELFQLALEELELNRFARAASRLSGWLRQSPGGPPEPGDAELLRAEWQKSRLAPTLAHLRSRDGRTLLRRMEFGESEAQAALQRWQDMRAHHRHDAIAELHSVRLELARSQGKQEQPAEELLKLARNFHERGSKGRAAVMLRAAASCLPDTTTARLELGLRMLSIGNVAEATPWIQGAAKKLIEQGYADKAAAPLRTLLSAAPDSRSTKDLLSLARSKSARGRARRRQVLVGSCIAAVLALAAVARSHYQQDYERRVSEILERSDRPDAALALLDEHFPDGGTSEVESLRDKLDARLREIDESARNRWLETFGEIQQECGLGDPISGLQRALALEAPPRSRFSREPYPAIADLFDNVASRLDEDLAEAARDNLEEQEAANAEQRCRALLDDLETLVRSHQSTPDLERLRGRLDGVRAVLTERSEQRARDREEREKSDRYKLQDQLLQIARAHAQAGDLGRATQTWERLLAMEGGDVIAAVCRDEIAGVRAHFEALTHARELAARGEHEAALEALAEHCDNPREHLMPWRLDSRPSGARVRVFGENLRTTPFTVESAFGEPVSLDFDLDGYETTRIEFDSPADRVVALSRKPERVWPTQRRIEAPPVSVGDDHVVCDRKGSVARVNALGHELWRRDLESLGGIARAPVFLPARAGFLLVLTEDGDAWLIEAATGGLEGPWRVGSPPLEGPIAGANTVNARFASGEVVSWRDNVKPASTELATNDPLSRGAGSNAGLAVLRRQETLERELQSPWSNWIAQMQDGYLIARPSDGGDRDALHVRVEGEWTYLAWEAPSSKIPRGRLWLADGRGLRGFEP